VKFEIGKGKKETGHRQIGGGTASGERYFNNGEEKKNARWE